MSIFDSDEFMPKDKFKLVNKASKNNAAFEDKEKTH